MKWNIFCSANKMNSKRYCHGNIIRRDNDDNDGNNDNANNSIIFDARACDILRDVFH